MEWNGEVVSEKVVWFQYESDITLNSNVFEVAQKLVQKHFPGIYTSAWSTEKILFQWTLIIHVSHCVGILDKCFMYKQ